ncbi:uncharacterized protein LOC141860874 isoform X5 [Acropora palmata]|uniref:uncharacterized protein LOC141860874 isoform X5 n=1 Tax=Acropora palmata TaxID=6131 RepID=UPI003DA19CE8
MQELILCNFPALRGQDLTRIRLYKSTSRGSQLIRICTGIPEAKEIMKLLGRSKSKKILIHLKRHNPGASSSGPPDSQTALTQPLAFAPQDTLSIISSSQSPSATSYPLSTLPSPSMATMTVPSSSTRPPVSTFSSNRSTSMYSTTTIVSTASSLVSSHLPLTTTTTRTRRPTGGHSTRQYLAQLAQSNIADGTQLAPLRIDVDSDDNLSDLLDSPLDETTVQVANNTDPAQGLQTAPPSKVTGLLKSFGGSDIPVTIIAGTSEDPFYGEGTRAGRVTENFSSLGLGGITETMFSRTEEVARCIQLMQQSCIDNNLASEVTIPPFMNHSFEEICWQAHDSRRAVVVVLLNPSSHHNQSRSAMLRVLQRLQEACQESDWFFPWVAETSSISGERVGTLYGHRDYDQIIILAPSSRQTPVFVDRVGGADFHNFDHKTLYERVKIMIEGLSLERERLSQWRLLRKEQEKNLQDIQEKERAMTDEERRNVHVQNERILRDVRRGRYMEEPTNETATYKVILVYRNEKTERRFCHGAVFQEVYDWAGTLEELPIHFTLHSGGKLILHSDHIEGNSVVHVSRWEKEEASSLLASEVSFRGNYMSPQDTLSATVLDASHCNHRDTTSFVETHTEKIAVSLPAQGTAAAKGQEATKGSAAKGSALPNQSEAQKESGEATGSAAPKGLEEIISPADNGNKASFIDHAQDVSSKDEAHEQRKEEQNQKRKRRDKRSTAQRKKSKKLKFKNNKKS